MRNTIDVKEFSYWKNPEIKRDSYKYSLVFLSALTLSSFAGLLATNNDDISIHLKDPLFLFNRIDTTWIHAYIGDGLLLGMIALFMLFPRYTPFSLISLSLLLFFRSIFINLTQLGTPLGQIPIISPFTFGGDLFFSGHTAIPVLLAFVFFDKKPIRYSLFAVAAFLGIGAILGRYHYSIDVLAAPFIAYSVFALSKNLFKKSYSYIEKKRPMLTTTN